MKIKRIELKNFKRFTDLVVEGIPENAKLVLLIGSNGSGKSSLFDAFELVNSLKRHDKTDYTYYRKNQSFSIALQIETFIGDIYQTNEIKSEATLRPNNSFYGRTSFRQVPILTRTMLGQGGNINLAGDTDRPRAYIYPDIRFENDIEKITETILKEFFRTDNSTIEIRKRYIEPINKAFENIFGSSNGTRLELIEIIPPLEGKIAQINFRKGNSEIHYNYLSAGEKEIFNILVNLLSRGGLYSDSVLFFDEIDLHLNTKLQFNLIKEITENWVPPQSQLWTASHSLGFIEYARQNENAIIIDFDDLDFDLPKVLMPEPKDNLDIYEIAVPKTVLHELLRGKKIIICENQNDKYYNLLSIPDTVFVGVKDSRSVFLSVKRDGQAQSIRDRDFLSDTEIEKIEGHYPGHHILEYYAFENYIYHPDNISEVLGAGFDKEQYTEEILKQKRAKLNYILTSIGTSRQNYEEFKTDNIKDRNVNSIVDDLSSDDFERFYKFFDMKDEFDKTFLAGLNLRKEDLVKTKWLKGKIEALLQ